MDFSARSLLGRYDNKGIYGPPAFENHIEAMQWCQHQPQRLRRGGAARDSAALPRDTGKLHKTKHSRSVLLIQKMKISHPESKRLLRLTGSPRLRLYLRYFTLVSETRERMGTPRRPPYPQLSYASKMVALNVIDQGSSLISSVGPSSKLLSSPKLTSQRRSPYDIRHPRAGGFPGDA